LTLETEVLLLGSPATDKGVSSGAPAVDERGATRPDGGLINLPDVGAAEGGPIRKVVGGGGVTTSTVAATSTATGSGTPTPPPPSTGQTSAATSGTAVNNGPTPTFSPSTTTMDLAPLQAEATGLFQSLVGRPPAADQLNQLVALIEGGASVGQLKAFI